MEIVFSFSNRADSVFCFTCEVKLFISSRRSKILFFSFCSRFKLASRLFKSYFKQVFSSRAVSSDSRASNKLVSLAKAHTFTFSISCAKNFLVTSADFKAEYSSEFSAKLCFVSLSKVASFASRFSLSLFKLLI